MPQIRSGRLVDSVACNIPALRRAGKRNSEELRLSLPESPLCSSGTNPRDPSTKGEKEGAHPECQTA